MAGSVESVIATAPSETADEALMLAYQAGDAAAFDTLYQRYRSRLFTFLVRESGSRAQGEELYQETWLRVIRYRGQYTVQARFSTYLFQLAHSCLMDHFRKQGRIGRFELGVVELPEVFACPSEAPEAVWGQQRTALRLRRCLDELPLEQREVFLLKEEGEMALTEIATVTGVAMETAKSRLRYALKKLRVCLEA